MLTRSRLKLVALILIALIAMILTASLATALLVRHINSYSGIQKFQPSTGPKGIISHIAGSDGMYVVDVWESQRDFDTFADSRLKPAFESVGGLMMPSVTTFVVHNSYSS
jgi:hypothetical protein